MRNLRHAHGSERELLQMRQLREHKRVLIAAGLRRVTRQHLLEFA